MVLCFITGIAYALQIETHDTAVYEFRNGKQLTKGIKQGFIYDVDLEKGTIEIKGEQDIYKIVSAENGNITAVRIRPQGEEMFVFKNDGTYCLFLTNYFPEKVMGVQGFFTNLFFGEYTMRE